MQYRANLSYHVSRGCIVTLPYHVIMSYPLVMPYQASMPGRVIMPYHAQPCRSCHAMPYRAQCRGPVGPYRGQRAPARPAQSIVRPPTDTTAPVPYSGEGILTVRVDSGQVVGANPPNMNLPLYWCSLLCLARAVPGIPRGVCGPGVQAVRHP